jgi:hypothetical protein
MSKRTRLTLLLVALALIGLAVAALAFSFPEVSPRLLQATIAPTLFTPPPP